MLWVLSTGRFISVGLNSHTASVDGHLSILIAGGSSFLSWLVTVYLFIIYFFSIISSCRWCTEKTPCAKEIRRAISWQLGGVYFPGQNSLRRVKLCEVILCGQMSPFRLSVHVLLAWVRGWKWTGVVQHTLLRLLLLDAAGEQPDQPTPDTEERKHQQSIVIKMTHHRGSRENEKAQTRSGFVFVFGLGATAADVWCTSCGPFFF